MTLEPLTNVMQVTDTVLCDREVMNKVYIKCVTW